MTGSVFEACTSAIRSGEPEMVVISQAAATAWISPPKLEASVANQTARKIGWANGTNGEAGAGASSREGSSSSAGCVSRSPGMRASV